MKKTRKKNVIAYALIAAILAGGLVFLTPKAAPITRAADTVVTETSPGGYDDYTTESNQRLGITGSLTTTPRTGDSNYSFALRPTVSFAAVQTETTYGDTFDRSFTFDLGTNYADQYIYVPLTIPGEEGLAAIQQMSSLSRGSLNDTTYSPMRIIFTCVDGDDNTQTAVYYVYRNFFEEYDGYYRAPLSIWFNSDVLANPRELENVRVTSIQIRSSKIVFAIAEVPNVTHSVVGGAAKLNYTLRLDNPDLRDLRDGSRYWYTFYFDLWRVGISSEQILTRYVVHFNRDRLVEWVRNEAPTFPFNAREYLQNIPAVMSDGETVVAKKDFTYTLGKMTLTPEQVFSAQIGTSSGGESKHMTDRLKKNGYEILYSVDQRHYSGDNIVINDDLLSGLKFQTISGSPSIVYSISTTDYDAQYRCRFGYIVEELIVNIETGFLGIPTGGSYEEKIYKAGLIESEAASVYDVLSRLDDAGTLARTYSGRELELANLVLDQANTRTVEIIMLEQIPGTPFARKVKKTITAPVRNNTLRYDSICHALDLPTLKVLNSNVESIVTMNNDGQFELVYLSAVWLHAASVSGSSIDMFLDLNESFETFYNRQTGFNIERDQNGRIITGEENANKAIITLGIYEYFLNSIKNSFPVLEQYNANEIFGYWGFFAIPREYNLDAAWKEIFGTSTQYKNVAHYFRHDVQISTEAYDLLLNTYGQSWLERMFNEIVGGVNGYEATYYMLYVDDAGYTAVSDSGSTNPEDHDGIVKNTADDVVGGIISTITSVFDYFSNTWQTYLTVAIVAGIAVVVIIVLSKSNKKSKGRRK